MQTRGVSYHFVHDNTGIIFNMVKNVYIGNGSIPTCLGADVIPLRIVTTEAWLKAKVTS